MLTPGPVDQWTVMIQYSATDDLTQETTRQIVRDPLAGPHAPANVLTPRQQCLLLHQPLCGSEILALLLSRGLLCRRARRSCHRPSTRLIYTEPAFAVSLLPSRGRRS